ncbi:MAG TPA: AI-2E family transporter [Anaerolineales bacterium]|nr:AI-2E family transporter [Anaerolineales bacterium]
MNQTEPSASPAWGATTKLVVALTFVAVVAWLLFRFEGIIAPLLMAFVLAYLFYPVASFLQRVFRFPWRLAVGLIYLLLLGVLISLLAVGGLGLIQQIQNLVAFVQNSLTVVPGLIKQFTGQLYQFGPFQFDFRHLDLNALSQQLVSLIQPVLGRTGTLLGTIAGGAAQFLGWLLFVLLVSYFALSESGGARRRIVWLDIPGYTEDIRRLGHELGLIWNAFLRGQFIVFFFTFLVYLIVFSLVGVKYAIGIALLAGLAKFVPYFGEPVTWITLALVTYFQGSGLFGLLPLSYALASVAVAFLIDQTFDNLVTPRIFARALHVHPAAVLIAALVAASFLGLLGIIIAAPMLATVTLFWRYTVRKMLDLDPWPEGESTYPPPLSLARILVAVRNFWHTVRGRLIKSSP